MVEYSADPPEIAITGDAEGLRFLAEVCTRVIGKDGPAAHWHLKNAMGTLEAGAIDTVVIFDEQLASEQKS